MRLAWAWAAAMAAPLLFATLLAAAAVQPGPGEVRLAEDPTGDEGVSLADQGTPASRWAASDLVSLDLSEDARGYRFVLGVRALGTENAPIVDGVSYDTYFTSKGKPYAIAIFYSGETGQAFAYLTEPDPDFGGLYAGSEELAVTTDADAATFTVTVPHDLLIGPDGAPLLKGDLLQGFYSEATTLGGVLVAGLTEGTARIEDRMPDAGASSVVWTVKTGPELHGTVRSYSPSPVRVSNGEATTFLFEVTIANLADRLDTFELSASRLPPNWVVTFPQEEVRVDASSEHTVPVLVTVPFAHIHGVFSTFNVTVQSRSDPLTYGDVRLGVRYTAVPQPAGHHDTLYLHDMGNGRLFVNTLETADIPAEEATGLPGTSTCSFSSLNGSGRGQIVPLVPGFDLGLDMDMTRQGSAKVVIHSEVPVVDGYSAGGHVVVWYGNDRVSACASGTPEQAVAVLERSAPFSVDAGGETVLDLVITPLPYGDRLEHADDIHFALVLALYEEGPAHVPICCIGSEYPSYVEGSTFQLPLNEYHDPVDTYFSTLSGIDLVAVTPQQRLVNPGETVIFQLEAHNLGDQASTFQLELTGSRVEWARVLGDLRFGLGGGGSRTLAVAVTPPMEAGDGDIVDITLHAVSSADSNVRSLVRLLATVDTDADHPDQSAEVDAISNSLQGKESPGLSSVLLLGALALGAAGQRRRRI